jgi:ABC-type antimicrobial peptide transport system permease subunit
MPESMKDWQQIEMTFEHTYMSGLESKTNKTTHIFEVAGYYIDKGNSRIYCPYAVMQKIHAQLGAAKEMEEVCAVLNDNSNLPQLREAAALWFAEPNPSGEKTPWGRFDYEYYLYALDIDDYMLKNLESNMKSSMQLNSLASAAVFILSAGAGFLTGFLVIRARKREIALMRTMGASHPAIFLELALEQLLCVVGGIVVGGAVFLWQPLEQLALFGGIYFVGLSIALVIFLCKNLMTTIKEDE